MDLGQTFRCLHPLNEFNSWSANVIALVPPDIVVHVVLHVGIDDLLETFVVLFNLRLSGHQKIQVHIEIKQMRGKPIMDFLQGIVTS